MGQADVFLVPFSRKLGHTLWELDSWPWKSQSKWRFLAGQIIYKWVIFHSYAKEPEGIII
jgi:hypothetical protein